jgi:hypothetical protein
MVEKCVNPECSASFRYLREGRVFVTEVEGDSRTEGKARPGQFRYVWLCNSCCRKMTVVVEKGQGIKVVPLVAVSITAKAASCLSSGLRLAQQFRTNKTWRRQRTMVSPPVPNPEKSVSHGKRSDKETSQSLRNQPTP